MTKTKLWAFLIISLFWSYHTKAQESLNSFGGDISGSGGSVAFSIGQLVYTTNSTATGSIAQGIQLPYEIFNVGIDGSGLDISLTLYPNPTADQLFLEVCEYNNQKLKFQLVDIQSKLLNEAAIVSQHTTIEMKNLPSAIYFIHVLDSENKTDRTFKIIKN